MAQASGFKTYGLSEPGLRSLSANDLDLIEYLERRRHDHHARFHPVDDQDAWPFDLDEASE